MFKINGNQTEFTQWEQGKSLLNPNMEVGDKVYFNSGSGEAATMYAYEADGTVLVDVPNSILRFDRRIKVTLQKDASDTTFFDVTASNKPSDYIYENNEYRKDKPTSGGGVSSWNDLTDKPFYEEVGEIEILPEQTLVLEEVDGAMGTNLTSLGFVDGQEYTVNYNGVEYVRNAFLFADMGGILLGNASAFGFEDTGEPFLIADIPSMSVASLMSLDRKSEVEISITYNGTVVHPLQEKFLPKTPKIHVDYYEYTEQKFMYAYTDGTMSTKIPASDLVKLFERGALVYDGASAYRPLSMENGGTVAKIVIKRNDTEINIFSAEYTA